MAQVGTGVARYEYIQYSSSNNKLQGAGHANKPLLTISVYPYTFKRWPK
jgi:hypothetical protein